MPELIAEKLKRLRDERGLSRSQLSRATVTIGYAGVAEVTIRNIEREPGRVPKADIIEALARALEVDPDEFHEFPIAAARRSATEPDHAALAEAAAQATEQAARETRAASERRAGGRRATG